MTEPEKKEGKESGGLVEGAVDKIASNLELLIRYFMTGIVVSAATLASRADWEELVCLAEEHAQLAGISVVVVGFLAFIMYRMVSWALLDGLFWMAEQSAPALYSKFSSKKRGYNAPYAEFLLWRYSKKITESLSGYLTYRWSVVHFMIVSAVTLIIATCAKQANSPMAEHVCLVLATAGFFGLLALHQFWFLLRVEKDLCQKTK